MSSLTPRAGSHLLLPLLFSFLAAVASAQPAISLSTNAPLCAGASLLTITESGSDGVSWQWNGPNNFTGNGAVLSIVNPPLTAAGTYYVTVTDGAGATATASIQVVMHEPVPMVCNDHVIVSVDANGQAVVLPQTVLQGSFNYDFYTVEIFNAQGIALGNVVTCDHIGQALTYKVTDVCNGNSCWGHLKVEDKMPPKLVCKDILYSCAIGQYDPEYIENGLGEPLGYPEISDNCGNVTVDYEGQLFELDCALPINFIAISSAWYRREWRATDASGNKKTCAQVIYFVRRHLSDIIMPADTVLNCQTPDADPAKTGAPYMIEYNQNFGFYPNTAFCEIHTGFSDEIVVACDGTRKIVRTWTLIEDCPLTGEPDFLIHQQLIEIKDTLPPVFVCPANMTVNIDPLNCCAVVDLPDVLIQDNCSRISRIEAVVQVFDYFTNDSIATYGINGTLSSFNNNNLWVPDTMGVLGVTPCLPRDIHLVTYRAFDDCGNIHSCSFTLSVEDKSPPVATCQTVTKVGLGIEGLAEIFAETFNDGSFDYCCQTTLYAQRMDSTLNDTTGFTPTVWFSCEDVGDTVMVAMRVVDCADNQSDCMVRVYVEDKIRPSCIAPPHLNVDCAGFDPTLVAFGFAQAADNCCMDTILAAVNYNQFDSICNRGTIVRTFRAFDCYGNSSLCTQRVVVDYDQFYYLKMPDDKIVNTCDGTGNFGEPTLHFEDCELIGLSYEDEVFTVVPEGCYRIDRHWKIINWCTYNPNGACIIIPNPDISQQRPFILPGPIISPFGTPAPWSPTITLVHPSDPAPTNYSIFWDKNANCYEYKQMILVFDTKDPIIDNCPQTPVEVCDQTSNNPLLWKDAAWWEAATSSHDLCEAPTTLSVTASDACTGSNIRFRYLLFLDLDNNGSMETVVNSNNPPPPGMVYYNNVNTANFTGGELRPFDNRAVPSNQKFSFGVYETVVGNKRTALAQWKTAAQLASTAMPGILPELPFGRHKIKWLVEDGCTNESFCEHTFVVKDCKKPTVVCLNGLSVNIPATGTVALWATDFLQYTNDNCTPTPLLRLGIRKAGTGVGFPFDASGAPITGITFDCTEIGTQAVELWSVDLAGNADYCETFVVVQDNLGACGASAAVSGAIQTEVQEGVEQVNVNITGSSTFAPSFQFFDLSDNNGNFDFSAIPLLSNYTLTPAKDDNPINGVTTYDLVEITKHILGIKPLGSPYKMIAADANRSNSITSFDVVELRKLILGVYLDFPNNTSWRFVDKRFVFNNPLNPFQAPFPEKVSEVNLDSNAPGEDFIGIKIGDVNNTVVSNTGAKPDIRANAPGALFTVVSTSPQLVQAGEVFQLKITSPTSLMGYQFTLQGSGMEVLELLPGEKMKPEFFALFPDKQALSVACDVPGSTTFFLTCKAVQAGNWQQMVQFNSSITPALAYEQADEPVLLRPVMQFATPGRFEVYPVQPNPFVNKTTIGFYQPDAGETRLLITDVHGSVVWNTKQMCEQGYNTFNIDLQHLQTTGLLYFNIETASGNASGKMVRTLRP